MQSKLFFNINRTAFREKLPKFFILQMLRKQVRSQNMKQGIIKHLISYNIYITGCENVYGNWAENKNCWQFLVAIAFFPGYSVKIFLQKVFAEIATET